jgi:S1-C subfamily serine protease
MNWKKTFAATAGSLLILAATAIGATTQASDIATIRDATVLLKNNGREVCTAVIVARPTGPVVYTAAHCIEGAINLDIEFEHDITLEHMKLPEGTEFSVSVVASSPFMENDVAVLKFDAEAIPVLPAVDMITKSDLVFGEELIAVGYPDIIGEQQILIQDGRFQEYDVISEKPNGTFIRTNISVAEGFSGGGLYVLRDGEYILVGVLSVKPSRDYQWLSSWFSNVLSGVVMGNPGTPSTGASDLDTPVISAM